MTLRHLLRFLLSCGVALAHLALFVVLIVFTNGALLGWVAWATCALLAVALLVRRRGRGHRIGAPAVGAVVAAAVAATVCIPLVPLDHRPPPPLPGVAMETVRLATGSDVAVYHYPARARARGTLVYIPGGPFGTIGSATHAFLRLLADRGYDVHAYEPAGGGRSALLPMGDYTLQRTTDDLAALLARFGRPVDVLGFSGGAVTLMHLLARPDAASLVRRAIVAEPGPMDGPTAALTGAKGRPNAAGLTPGPSGFRSTTTPRYGVAFGLMLLGVLPYDTGLITQAEGVNAFTEADLGTESAGGYCAADADRVPAPEGPGNFSFNAAGSLHWQRTVRSSPSIADALGESSVPTMVMIAECSAQIREWETRAITSLGRLERVQYLPDVGHLMWNGLGHSNDRAAAVVGAFLSGTPAPLPDYPRPADVPEFLAAGK